MINVEIEMTFLRFEAFSLCAFQQHSPMKFAKEIEGFPSKHTSYNKHMGEMYLSA